MEVTLLLFLHVSYKKKNQSIGRVYKYFITGLDTDFTDSKKYYEIA